MKLNLLPTTVSSANRGRNALIGSILLVALAGGATAYMAIQSSGYLARQTQIEQDAKPAADRAVAVAKEGDAVTADPSVAMLVKNVELSQQMTRHNDVYPKLYDDVRPYFPRFFRLTEISASPLTGGAATPASGAPVAPGAPGAPAAAPAAGAAGGATSVIRMRGVIRTYQEYADLMLALLRNPEAVSVYRSGYSGIEPEVPAVSAIDQNGRPRLPGATAIPDDPLDRLTYFTDQPREEGFRNSGGFGSGNLGTVEGVRTITPNASLIDVEVIVNRNLQTPDPRATLATIGGGGAAGGAGAPTGAPTGAPVGGPPSFGGPPGRPPGGPPTGSAARQAGAGGAAGVDE